MKIVLYVKKFEGKLGAHGFEYDELLEKRKGGHSKFASTTSGYKLPTELLEDESFVKVVNYIDIHWLEPEQDYETFVKYLLTTSGYEHVTLISGDINIDTVNEIDNTKTFVRIDDGSDFWKQLNQIQHINLESTTFLTANGDEYWRYKIVKPDLMHANNIYNTTHCEKGVYYTLSYKETLEIGANDGNVNYSALRLKNEIPIVEDIRVMFNTILGTDEGPYVIHLLLLRSKVVTNLLWMYKDYLDKLIVITTFDRLRAKIPRVFIGEYKVASLLFPPNLALKTMDKLDVLDRVLLDSLKKDKIYGYIDITDRLYENGKIHKDFLQNTKLMKFDIRTEAGKYKVPIVFGIDTIDRNAFKRLEKTNPIVTLIYREFGGSLQYWVTVQTDVGNGIYACVHGNTVLNLQRSK